MSNEIKNIILQDVLKAPIHTILNNANLYNEKEELLELMKDNKTFGVNTNTKKVVNMYKEGVIDPVKSLISALNNSFANTKLLINTSYIINNKFDKLPI